MNEIYKQIKETVGMFLGKLPFTHKPHDPLWLMINLYHGSQLIDIFYVCPDGGRIIVSETRYHGYKIKTKVLTGETNK